MNQEFRDLLARLAPGEKPERLASMGAELDALKGWLTSVLNNLKDASAQQEMLAYFHASALAALKNGQADADMMHLTPELLEWARSQVNVEEILAAVAEIERTGGYELSDFIHELEGSESP